MRKLLMTLALVAAVHIYAQDEAGHSTSPQVELFCGADLNYADVNFARLYNLLINLTPGVKWHLGNDWLIAANAWVPLINDGYDSRYHMARLNTAVVSKELHFENARQHAKISVGLFSRERWGADVKWMMPVNDWLLLNAQAGLTKHWALGFDMYGNSETDFDGKLTATAIAGANFYLTPWNTEFRLSGGRYINEDYGAQLEVMRHFKYCTITAYAQLHERGNTRYSNHTEAGGFKVVMMLPPYQKRTKKLVLRPPSNFRLTYIAQSDGISMRMYNTDPEENERQLPMRIGWGTGTMKGGVR